MTKKQIKEILNKNDYKFTNQRKLIANLLIETDDHLTIKKICQKIKDPNLGQATIYRTMKIFDKLNIVRKINFGDGDYYEINTLEKQHHHLICSKCGKIIEVDFDSLKSLEDDINKIYGFSIKNCILKFSGICEKCQKKEGGYAQAEKK